jgi:hypothetical protein
MCYRVSRVLLQGELVRGGVSRMMETISQEARLKCFDTRWWTQMCWATDAAIQDVEVGMRLGGWQNCCESQEKRDRMRR